MNNDYRRYHLAHDEAYKSLNLIHKYDTASLQRLMGAKTSSIS